MKKPREGEEQYKRSQELLDRLLADFPNDCDAKSQLGTTLNNLASFVEDRGDSRTAREMLERAVENQRAAMAANPRDPQPREYLAIHYRRLYGINFDLKDRVEAVRWADEAAKLNPKDVSLLNQMAYAFANVQDPKLRDLNRSIAWAKRAIELLPNEEGLHYTLGTAYFRAGDNRAAVEAIKKSMAMSNGGEGLHWYFLAMALFKLGEKEEAAKWFMKAKKWRETNTPKDMGNSLLHAEAAGVLEFNDAVKFDKAPVPSATPPNKSSASGVAKP